MISSSTLKRFIVLQDPRTLNKIVTMTARYVVVNELLKDKGNFRVASSNIEVCDEVYKYKH